MVKLHDIYLARSRIGASVRKTPFEYSSYLSKVVGSEIFLKFENRQITGSFKIRGAVNRLSLLTSEEKKKGIVAASSGNHAQGVSYAAQKLGVKATIVVPENTPRIKREAIVSLGAHLIVHGEEYMDAERLAQEISKNQSAPFISPYNDKDLIAGQGTVALEMVEEQPELDAVLVPVSGGGLISGVATVMNETSNSEVIGVQTEASPVMYECVKAGKIIDIEMYDTVAEGLHGGIEQGSITFPICQKLVNHWLVVKEKTIIDAMKLMLFRQHEVLEGSGAVGIAALLENPNLFKCKKVGVILSGGNIDDILLTRIITS